ILTDDSYVLAISENGYGKATEASQYAIRRRGGKGVKTFKITERNGSLVGLSTIIGDEDILLITNEGIIIRFEANDISRTGRDTQGVRLMRLDEEQFISTLCIVDPTDEEDSETASLENEVEFDEEESKRPTEVDELIKRAEEDLNDDLNDSEEE